MRTSVNTYLSKLNKTNSAHSALRQSVFVLSLVVMLGVFWSLKLTGITMAGDAFCGIAEHIHGESCPPGQLICEMEETEGHMHDESCILRQLCCELPEVVSHVHTEACMEYVLTCELEACEGHLHDDSCRSVVQICTIPESEGHVHEEICYEQNLICTADGEDPDHIHGENCYESILVCSQEEHEGHIHEDACFVLSEEWCCGLEEVQGHAHSEACYAQVEDHMICGLEASEGHQHTDACYYIGIGFGCGMTEAEGHIHTEECLTEETELDCGMEYAAAHLHTEECYILSEVCPLMEHIHTESCYSDINADLETEDDWEYSLRQVEEEFTTGETLAAVARSQLGYEESQRNFEVDLFGIRRGITRYGQWYGNPYGDWSAMFASFCLHYAGVEDLPANAGPESMRLEWEEEGLYCAADEYQPRVGDLLFLHLEDQVLYDVQLFSDGDSEELLEDFESVEDTEESIAVYTHAEDAASAVAIITEVDEYSVTVIQGDVDGVVKELYFELDDPAILGYGLVPERSPYVMMKSPRAGDLNYLAQTMNFNTNMFTNGRSFVIYAEQDGQYYAIASQPASGFETSVAAVPIVIDEDGSIYTDLEDADSLLWNFSASNGNYIIQNEATGRYLHPGGDYGVIYDGNWPTALRANGTGAQFVHTSNYDNVGIYFNPGNQCFEIVRNKSDATTLYFGVAEQCTVWLDGTQGDLMSLRGSDLENYTVISGGTFTLPSRWKSPTKYSYVLKGWYDVERGLYYEPGEEITVSGNTLFYADWEAQTYDIGEMNSDVVETISTNEFITTRIFDYNSLFNTLSLNNDYNEDIGGSSTQWTLVEDGIVDVTDEETLNFIFVDHDSSGSISHPDGRNVENGVEYQVVTPGLYNESLGELLFDPDVEVFGKQYLGTADHLFQYGDDPSDPEHYGYYYYDSQRNAASYNQSNQRFYVYDYLERTTDSPGNDSYSDFLPLNSPYANTNEKAVGTYTHNGQFGYYYDAKYSDSSNSTGRVGVNYAFGLAINMEFYLSAVPGTVDSEGTAANQSITGDDMVFEFSGDDDVWVLIDGQLVLDIGGIHLVKSGSIDFSNGEVIVEGEQTGSVTYLKPGSHTLTMYYLERGASMSNFKLRFNLSTRYSLTLRKEDTLTAQMLNGAQFAVFTNEACTEQYAAELWTSRSAHERGEDSTNVFTVEDGKAEMWGLAAGNTYYLVEIRGPDTMQGVPAKGIIHMRLNNQGQPDYEVRPDHGDLTVGYMVHGYKVNEDKQEAYLVITNTDATQSKPTQISVEKVWNDTEDHSGDSITAYLVANGVRIQSVTLHEGNDWKHTWVNLPSTDRNNEPVLYTVHEATFPGYISVVTGVSGGTGGSTSGGTIQDANGFENGKTYLLYTKFGYIGAANNSLLLQSDQDTVQNNNNYLWSAAVHSDGTVTLTNANGQILYWDSYMLKASSTPGTNKNLYYTGGTLQHLIREWNQWQYPGDSTNVPNNVIYNQGIYTTNSGAALAITPQALVPDAPPEPDEGDDEDAPIRDFRITNIPVGDATVSLKVNKVWDLGDLATEEEYMELSVRMDLLANGEDSGLSGVLNLRNGWSYTFQDLPMFDSRGHEITYAVREAETNVLWRVDYGPVVPINGSPNAYETTVTNIYRATVQLPSTGRSGPYGYVMLGLSIMLGGWGWYRREKRKDERREC